MAMFHVGGSQMALMEVAQLQNRVISLQNKNTNQKEQLRLLHQCLEKKLKIMKGSHDNIEVANTVLAFVDTLVQAERYEEAIACGKAAVKIRERHNAPDTNDAKNELTSAEQAKKDGPTSGCSNGMCGKLPQSIVCGNCSLAKYCSDACKSAHAALHAPLCKIMSNP